MKIKTAAAGMLVLLTAQSVAGTELVCSNPSREKVLQTATIVLPTGNIGLLKRRFEKLAGPLGMTTWGTVLSERGAVESQTLGLQSPKVSVSISANWKSGQRFARAKVERTCFTDDLEPWKGYWSRFLAGLRASGFKVTVP